MKFTYKARTKDGELQTGSVEAPNRDMAANILSKHDLFVLTLEEVVTSHWYDFLLGFVKRIKIKDLMVFTRQFATILSAKIPLNEALVTLRKQTKNPYLRDILLEMSGDIDAGLSLSQAFEKHSDVFSVFYVNMIRSAELTGRVEESVNYLADYVEKEATLSMKIKNALIYPAIMVILFIFVASFMGAAVLPKIEPIFIESGVDLPLLTSVLIAGGKFMANWWWALLIGTIGAVVLLIDYFKSKEGRLTLDEILLRLPVFKKLFKDIYVSRFAESVSILVKGGISITQALEVSSRTIGSAIYSELLDKAAEDVRRGELLSDALNKNERFFPPLLVQMIAIGETTGRLEEMLGRAGEFYTREIDGTVGNLVELIQPILMLVIGGSVGILFASILIPIFNLAQTL